MASEHRNVAVTAANQSPRDITAKPTSPNPTGPYVSSSVAQVNGQKVVRLKATEATFAIGEDGALLARDQQGNVIDSTPAEFTINDVRYVLKFTVSNDATQADVEYQVKTASAEITTRTVVNKNCALNNLLWGLGSGAITGGGAGVPGVVVGALTGAIISGVQSATSC